jgi:hypothetical protein
MCRKDGETQCSLVEDGREGGRPLCPRKRGAASAAGRLGGKLRRRATARAKEQNGEKYRSLLFAARGEIWDGSVNGTRQKRM